MFITGVRLAILLVTLTPASAFADWLFTPGIGTTFGADTHGREHTSYSGALAWLDEEIFGFELDVSYTPNFFEGQYDDFFFAGDSNVLGFMGNAVIGAMPDSAVHPYVTGGIGLMQMHVVSTGVELFESTTRELGWNAGAGIIAMFGERVGLRGDFRYIRSFENEPPSWTRGIDFDVAPGNFDFMRAIVGVTIRFPE
jgi:opacity protein-like surface antigen